MAHSTRGLRRIAQCAHAAVHPPGFSVETVFWRAREDSQSSSGLAKRRVTQAEGVQWFIQLAKQSAPELEVFELPRYSTFPLLIRRRKAIDASVFEGAWSPVQVRATTTWQRQLGVDWEQACTEAEEKKSGGWYYVSNRTAYRRHPDVPCIVMSPFSMSCFVFAESANKAELRARPGSENEIDLKTPAGSEALGIWLRSVYSPTASMHAFLTESLESLFVKSGMTAAIRTHRIFLLQVFQLPILQKIVFRQKTLSETAYNATLFGRRLLIRGATRRNGAQGGRRLHYSFTHQRQTPLCRSSCGVDYFLLMVESKDSPGVLGGIGVIPLAAIEEPSRLLRERRADGDLWLKQQPVLALDASDNIVGGDFQGPFAEFFFHFSQQNTSSHPPFDRRVASFLHNIFTTWDHRTCGA
ncbi:unnamed protein product [Amoebophrya sp. A25]|nr:unnamed protein product [Amoebophrya sp. A25]|eukprot:GSA25T00021412001.1